MGLLAGWHLSCKKMLFFSGILFISLVIALHLSPYYFPSAFDFFPTSLSSSSSSCISLLDKIQWNTTKTSQLNSSKISWKWAESDENVLLGCDYQKLNSTDMGHLLNGSWVMVAGDSQTRFFVLSFLELLLGEEEIADVRNNLKYSDYHLDVSRLGLTVDFKWAPYAANLNNLVAELSKNSIFPDVFVIGYGLWNMLHVTNSTDYGDSLHVLNQALTSLFLVEVSPKSRPHLFWLNMPTLINSMLNTEEKREKMSDTVQNEYHQELSSSELFRPGSPFVLLDLKSLSGSCGVECTNDGMHYDRVVYEACVHIMLNVLIIQSQPKV
ncbi:protein ALTERED XYLOGLUCAN 9-like [Silene latifolia]|uniref:protein ALTERED XYLOGLUCAN 9-like n=1 Tax=Silene latifolia TaxID=37657 RepID=UPI003D782836